MNYIMDTNKAFIILFTLSFFLNHCHREQEFKKRLNFYVYAAPEWDVVGYMPVQAAETALENLLC